MSDALCSLPPADPQAEAGLARDEDTQNRGASGLAGMLKTATLGLSGSPGTWPGKGEVGSVSRSPEDHTSREFFHASLET